MLSAFSLRCCPTKKPLYPFLHAVQAPRLWCVAFENSVTCGKATPFFLLHHSFLTAKYSHDGGDRSHLRLACSTFPYHTVPSTFADFNLPDSRISLTFDYVSKSIATSDSHDSRVGSPGRRFKSESEGRMIAQRTILSMEMLTITYR